MSNITALVLFNDMAFFYTEIITSEAEKSRDAPERWTQERAIFVAATFFMGSGIKTPTKGVKA
jgi:hypothetical protein